MDNQNQYILDLLEQIKDLETSGTNLFIENARLMSLLDECDKDVFRLATEKIIIEEELEKVRHIVKRQSFLDFL